MNRDQRKAELFTDLVNTIESQFEDKEEDAPDLGTWCDKNNIVLDGREFSFRKHEYLIDAYKDPHPYQVYLKAAQLGLTSLALLRVMHGSRYGKYRGILYLFPSKTDVTDLSKGRLDPLIEDNPETIGSWIKDTNSANIKKVWNSPLYLRGMQSRIGLKCHDDKTEVLTGDGWKLFLDIKIGEILATINISTGQREWQPCTDVYKYEYRGNLLHFLSSSLDFCVTPKHRLLVIDSIIKSYFWLEAEEVCNINLDGLGVLIKYEEDRSFALTRFTLPSLLPYDGFVYCASVPNETLYTRRNGKTVWSGNSIPVDFVVFDELDEAPQKAVDMALERMGHSEIGESLFLSNPTMPDYGIDRLFQSTDQQYWLLKCPKCNHYTNLVDTFPDCLITVKGKVIRACEKCQAELNPSVGQWVAKYPQITERRGRQFSQLFSQSRTTAPETLLHMYRTTNNITSYMNLKVGVAHVEAQNRLSVQEVMDCCSDKGMSSESETGTYMGVDQGGKLHVVIGKTNEQRGGEVIYAAVHKGTDPNKPGDETGWLELDALMSRFKVVRCIIDALPNTKFARNFAERHRGRVYMNFYNEYQKGSIKWSDRELTAVANRTETLDASHNLITTQNILLPRESDAMRMFANHLHNVAKRLEEDEETGSQRYVYLKLGEDHFRHAFNYFVMCLQNTPEYMFPMLM